jgi:hypothetical protein
VNSLIVRVGGAAGAATARDAARQAINANVTPQAWLSNRRPGRRRKPEHVRA